MAVPTSREPTFDPAEPISPESVLVSPELREQALARERQFPTAVARTATPQPGAARAEASTPGRQPRRSRAFVLAAAAGAAVTLSAVALWPKTNDAPSLVSLPPDGGGVRTAVPTTRSTGTSVAPERERPQFARPATSATTTSVGRTTSAPPKRTAPASPAAGPSARRAERNILNSPRFFIRLGARGRRFVDPKTHLFRPGVSVRCTPLRETTHLSCVIRREKALLTFLYLRTSSHSFRLVHL